MDAPTPAERPYAVFKPHGDPKYYKTFKAARSAILGDLEALRYTWLRLKAQDALEATSALTEQVMQLDLEGGKIDGIVDPYTRIPYRADLVKR